jgi:hypothetical protein
MQQLPNGLKDYLTNISRGKRSECGGRCKKICYLLPVKTHCLLLLFLVSFNATSQEMLLKVSENYYRSLPFHNEFSRFVEHLLNDPTFIKDTIHKKTDSTLFYMRGSYRSHNPFFFKAIRTDVILAERQEPRYDSAGTYHTVFYYQIVGYAPPDEEGIRDVKLEFEKACRRYKRGFTGSNDRELKSGTEKTGEVRDYLFRHAAYPPLTISWLSSEGGKNNVFAITIRFMVYSNHAFLPVPPKGF